MLEFVRAAISTLHGLMIIILLIYGHPCCTLLQAIRKHKFVNVLDSPGDADLSAHVDFNALKHVVKDAAGET